MCRCIMSSCETLFFFYVFCSVSGSFLDFCSPPKGGAFQLQVFNRIFVSIAKFLEFRIPLWFLCKVKGTATGQKRIRPCILSKMTPTMGSKTQTKNQFEKWSMAVWSTLRQDVCLIINRCSGLHRKTQNGCHAQKHRGASLQPLKKTQIQGESDYLEPSRSADWFCNWCRVLAKNLP